MIRPRFFAKPWNPEEEERLRAMIISGMSLQEVSSELQRTVAGVRGKSGQLGIPLKQVTVKRPARLVEKIRAEEEKIDGRRYTENVECRPRIRFHPK
jgi:hypothetical protein